MVVRAERGNPIDPLFELESGDPRPETPDQRQRGGDAGQTRKIGPHADERLALAGNEEQDQKPGQRRQEYEAE